MKFDEYVKISDLINRDKFTVCRFRGFCFMWAKVYRFLRESLVALQV